MNEDDMTEEQHLIITTDAHSQLDKGRIPSISSGFGREDEDQHTAAHSAEKQKWPEEGSGHGALGAHGPNERVQLGAGGSPDDVQLFYNI